MATRAPSAATAPVSSRTARATIQLEDTWADHEFAQQLLQRVVPNLFRVVELKALGVLGYLQLLHSCATTAATIWTDLDDAGNSSRQPSSRTSWFSKGEEMS
jgi:recombinational DNA repair protein (RecF pathway)